MGIRVDFTSPAPGSSVPTSFKVTGTYGDDGTTPPEPGSFALQAIFVSVPGGSAVGATVNADGTWSAPVTLSPSVHHGDAVVVTYQANEIFSARDNPGDSFSDQFSGTLNLVAEIPDQVPPQVTVDAFDDDETVDHPPFRVPLLSGRASDSSGVAQVRYSIDDGPRLPVDSMTAVGGPTQVVWSKANLDFDIGRHKIQVFAQDTRGNEGSATVFVSVRSNIPPAPKDLAFASTTYLSELLSLAFRDLRIGAATTAPTVAAVGTRLGQPLSGIIAPASHAEAVLDLAQPRLAIEVLRSQFSAPPAAIEQQYRFSAYQALLRRLGTDFQELRLARGADAATRATLANRLGVAIGGTGAQHLDDVLLDPDTMSEAQLESLFGLRSTAPDNLTTAHPTANVLLWQRDAQRGQWADADHRDRDRPDLALPIVDPDLVDDNDFVDREASNPTYSLWLQRRQLVASMLADATTAVAGANRTLAGFDAAVANATRTTDGRTLNIAAITADETTGVDISGELAPFGLSLDAFRYLARLRALLATASLTEGEWRDTASILVQSRKAALARQWRLEEVGAHVVLGPGTFHVDTPLAAADPTDPLRWRRPTNLRLQWLRTLKQRAKDADNLTAAWQASVEVVEQSTLPALRDAIIADLGQRQNPTQTRAVMAERLSRQLCIDLQAAPGTRTNRVTQAIDSVQALLVGARSGLFAGTGGDQLVSGTEITFDLEFAWLSSYSRWLAAINAFAYPENQLRPSRFVLEHVTNDIGLAPTAAFTHLLDSLATGAQITPEQVRRDGDGLAAQYLSDLAKEVGPLPAGIALDDRRSNDQLLAYQTAAQGILAKAGPNSTAITREQDVPQQYREIFWLVPMALARKLQDGGSYQAALDWYRTVFAFQLPPGQRLIYPGLSFEANLHSDFGRLPDWLAQTAELNPHLTARKRKGAYTKHTVMSIVECFLAFGDAEFSRSTPDSNARAQTLYQTAADLLDLPEAAPEEGDAVPFPRNAVWQSLRDQAANGLSKIHAGLNLAGQADLDAGRTSTLPSQYRYSVLVDRARNLVATAQQLEAAYLSALVQGENNAYSEAQAQRDLATAGAMLGVEDLKVTAAGIGVTQAQIQRDKSAFQVDRFSQLIEAGTNGSERDQLVQLEAARDLDLGSAAVKAFGIFGDNPLSSIGDTLSALSGAASLDAQIDGLQASFERRQEDWLFQRANAARDVELGDQQIAAAQTQQQIATADRDVASQRLDFAAQTADFLANKFTNSALFEWMSGVLGGVYAYFLQQGTTLAQLAQAQLAFERQEPSRDLIQSDYWQGTPDPGQLADSPDRRGLTAAERLLADITRLDEFAFDTDRRKLQLSQTLPLSRFAAAELQQFRQTGLLSFATPQRLFDQSFPGHYLRLVKRVKVSVVALVPPVRGICATLSASGVSRAVVVGDTFETVTLRREPESIAFTGTVNANGLFELAPEDGKLLPFEGMGVDTVWQLEMPLAANPFDFRTIADVLFTMEYTALDSPDYRETVIQSLDTQVTADRSISVRDDLPDAWFALNNPATVDDPTQVMRVALPLSASDFPVGLSDLTVAQLTLFVVRADSFTSELDVTAVRRTVAGTTVAAGQVRTVGGIVGTRRPGGAPWQVLQGAPPIGDWEIVLPNTPQVQSWFTNGQIQDLVLVFTLTATTPPWPSS
jgi:hypothetical protein